MREPRGIRDVVRRLADRADLRYGARRVTAADALAAALAEVLGAERAAGCRVGAMIGAEARIECRENATAQRVRFQTPQILAAVQARLDADDVTALRVSVATESWPAHE